MAEAQTNDPKQFLTAEQADLLFGVFLSQVEDVCDPTRSNRVKVRVSGLDGYEGEGEDRVPNPTTEDLPWAGVAMPVTHSGGTFTTGSNHNMKVGDFVWTRLIDGNPRKRTVFAVAGPGVAVNPNDTEKPIAGPIPLTRTIVDDPETGNSVNPRVIAQDSDESGSQTSVGELGTEQQSDVAGGLLLPASPANPGGTFDTRVASASPGCTTTPAGDIENILAEFFATLQHTNGNIGTYYISKFTGKLFELQSIAKGYIQRVKSIMNAALSRAFGEMMAMLRKGVQALIKALLAPLPGVLTPVVDWFTQMLERLGCSMMDIGSMLGNFIENTILGYVGNIVNWSACQIKRFTDALFGRTLGMIEGVIDSVFGGISSVLGAIGGAIDIIGGGLASIMKLLGISCGGKKKCQPVKKKSSKVGSLEGLKSGFNSLDELLASLESGNHLPITSYCEDALTDPVGATEVNAWGPQVPDGGSGDSGEGTGTGIDFDDVVSSICSARFFKVEDTPETMAVIEGSTAEIRITRSGNLETTSSVTYRTLDGTAKANIDYCPVNGYIGFGIGESEKIITVNTIDNGVQDGSKYFFVKATGDGCGEMTKPTGRIWMKDSSTQSNVPGLTVPTVGAVSSTPQLNLDQPVYLLEADKSVVYEGEEVTFNLKTFNVDDGTVINYTLGRETTGIVWQDIEYIIGADGAKSYVDQEEDLQRQFTIMNGAASVTVKLKDDGIVEDGNQVAEQLYCELNNLATAAGVAVLDPKVDTSTDPTARSVAVEADKVTVEEGEEVRFTVTTKNFTDGELLSYSIFGTNITQADIVQPMSGNLYLENNKADIVIQIKEDRVQENQENLIFSIDNYGSQAVVIISASEDDPIETTDEPPADDDGTPVFSDPIIDDDGRIIDIEVKRSGHRYTSKPFITVDSNTGWGAYVEPILNSKGYLTRVRVIRPGKGYTGKTRPDTTICQLVGFHLTNVGGLYTSAPNVYVNGVSGIARATIGSSGYVTEIKLIAPEMTYIRTPIVTITGGGGFGAKAIPDLQCVPAEDSNLILQGLAKDPANYVDCP